jgi:anti-sigma-K factor RskA
VNDDDVLHSPFDDLLADAGTWAGADPSGADTLLAAIRAEQATRPAPQLAPPDSLDRPAPPPSPAPVAPTDQPAHLAPVVPLRRGRRFRLLAAAAAVVLVAGLSAVALSATLSGDDSDAREVAISGTDLAPDASATASVEELGSGVAIELDVSGLPPAEPGTYYQAWVKGDEEGELVTIGTFHMRAGDETVELWAGVDLDQYPTLTVTLQQEGAGPASSGQVVLTGQIGP